MLTIAGRTRKPDSGTSCTVTNFGFTNRSLVVDASDINLDPVCWGSCDNCGAGALYDITFQVNMNGVAGPFTTRELMETLTDGAEVVPL
ncbi:MAG: hypothetical protein IPI65_15525 [Bacteroidetes bacterium]|nr:hypothetical protein [Bacteroidota bacterium]